MHNTPLRRRWFRYSLRTLFAAFALTGVSLVLIGVAPVAGLCVSPFVAAILAQVLSNRGHKIWLRAQIVGVICGVATGATYGAILGWLAAGALLWSQVIFGIEVGALAGLVSGIVAAILFPLVWTYADWLTMPKVAGGRRRWQLPTALLTAFTAMTIFCILLALNRD